MTKVLTQMAERLSVERRYSFAIIPGLPDNPVAIRVSVTQEDLFRVSPGETWRRWEERGSVVIALRHLGAKWQAYDLKRRVEYR